MCVCVCVCVRVRVRVRLCVCVDMDWNSYSSSMLFTGTRNQTADVLMALIDLLIYVFVTSWFTLSLCKPAGFRTGGG